MDDKRNYSIIRGDGETLLSYLERIGEHMQKLRWQSDGHRMWYTHKNPYGCWICELLQVAEYYGAELQSLSVARKGDNIDEELNDLKTKST